MKKLMSVFLAAVMIMAVCFSITVSAANSVTNSLPEQSRFVYDESAYEYHGWIKTDSPVSAIYVRLFEVDTTVVDDAVIVDNISDEVRDNNNYTEGVSEVFRDSNLEAALGGAYGYRVHLYIDIKTLAPDYFNNLKEYADTDYQMAIRAKVGTKTKNIMVNIADMYYNIFPFDSTAKNRINVARRGTVAVNAGGVVTNERYNVTNDVAIPAKTEGDTSLPASTIDLDGNGVLDPYIDIPVPEVDASQYKSMSIRYKIEGDAHAGGNVYLRGKTYNTAYSATAGTYCPHGFINDGDWHTAEYIFSDDLTAMADKVITGVRIPGAGMNSKIWIDSITFNKDEAELGFTAANVSIKAGGKMDINFKADKNLFGAGKFEDPYVTFEGSDVHVEGVENENYLVFAFKDIEPDHMKDSIKATLHAKKDGADVTAELSYSIVDYCKDAYAANPDNGSLMTLLADMLNYGAFAQKYSGAADAELVTADGELSGLLAKATSTDPVINGLQGDPTTPIVGADKKVKWTNVGLRLDDEVSIRLKFSKTEDCTPDKVKFTIEGDNTAYNADVTSLGNGNYVSYLKIPVNKMRAIVSAIVYEGNVPVSNTLNYSVEYYAAAKQNDANANLAALVKAMIKYGDSAAAFAG